MLSLPLFQVKKSKTNLYKIFLIMCRGKPKFSKRYVAHQPYWETYNFFFNAQSMIHINLHTFGFFCPN